MLANNITTKLSNSRKLALEGVSSCCFSQKTESTEEEILSMSEMMIYYLIDSWPYRAFSLSQPVKQINLVC